VLCLLSMVPFLAVKVFRCRGSGGLHRITFIVVAATKNMTGATELVKAACRKSKRNCRNNIRVLILLPAALLRMCRTSFLQAGHAA
jgi:hypothetical protein